jgi:hypothetical protein
MSFEPLKFDKMATKFKMASETYIFLILLSKLQISTDFKKLECIQFPGVERNQVFVPTFFVFLLFSLKFYVKIAHFYLPHMEYEGSFGFVSRKMKKKLLLIFTF